MKSTGVSIVRFFLCIFGIFFIAGCSRPAEVAEDDPLAKYCGEYVLYSVVGEHCYDLNDDASAYRTLLDEFSQIAGYYEPNHFASVEKSLRISNSTEPALTFNVCLPYPNYIEKDGSYDVAGVAYLEQSIKLWQYQLDNPSEKRFVPGYADESNIFLSHINEMYISEFSEDSFTVRLDCFMYSLGFESVYPNEIVEYTYVRNQ